MDLVLSLTLLLFFNIKKSDGEILRKEVHQTPAAARPQNELWCYQCTTGFDPDRCNQINHNDTHLVHKCRDDKRQCMVKRYSYSTSTENTTSTVKLWSLERDCTKSCEPGCIIIGERTKLYACTTCCSTYLCNKGSGADVITLQRFSLLINSAIIVSQGFFIETYRL